ncbi:MAG: insulinase family protein [Lachnospiraceae bacterium]|nr:insulinase family protein [Lachnospiraceae bacterium]
MEQFKNIPGYELIGIEELKDAKGTGLLFRHKKTGARIGVVKNNDENKVFSIGFKTPPKDSTGVAHITEHTVLCGSEKFPSKDPFIELVKGSLNTFLNAMTFSDKTMYPVASCNDKDFRNLEDVYLDAVFHPNLHKVDEIFKQEGWHYELENENDDIKINGVVYSEMKGVFSNPDSVAQRSITDVLFPDTEYGVESGGDPDVIPDLTIENYRAFHKTFYHPSNSYIWLYGDIDVEEQLTWMDKAYLSEFDKIEVDSSIKVQKPYGTIKRFEKFYNVEEEREDGKGVYYSYNVLAGENTDLIKGLSFEVLDYCLFGAPGAPVKKALIDAGIGDEVFDYYDGGVLQPYFTVNVKNAKPGLTDKFVEVIRTALKKCADEGISQNTINAAINIQEFKYREADFGGYPKGLMYGITAMSTWLYNDNMVFDNMRMGEAYAELRKKVGTSWFEDIIREYFLDSKHGAVLTVLPKVGLNKEKSDALAKKLASYKASLSKDELKKLIDDTAKLKKYQSEPSSEEDTKKIPLLEISDIKKEGKDFNNEKILPYLGNVVWHDYDTNGIAYIRLGFKVDCLSSEELVYATLLNDSLAVVDTDKHGYGELNDEINMYTGGIHSNMDYYVDYNDYKKYTPFLFLNGSCLYGQIDKTFELMREIISGSKYNDVKRNKEIFLENKSGMESRLMGNGTAIASIRLRAYDSESGVFDDSVNGVGYYRGLKKIVEDYDKNADAVAEKIKEVAGKIFTRENLIVSIISDKDGADRCTKGIESIYDVLPSRKQAEALKLRVAVKNEGFKTPGTVQYVCRGGNFKKAGFDRSGVMNVLTSTLSYGYLWNEVRVKGGAYGAWMRLSMDSGFAYMGSYRDPNLRQTNEIFEKLPEYLEKFEADEREMTKAVIGTFGKIDSPLTPRQMGERAFNAYVCGRTFEDVMKERNEALNCTVQDLRNVAPLIRSILDQKLMCTIGSASAVDECKDLFKDVESIL